MNSSATDNGSTSTRRVLQLGFDSNFCFGGKSGSFRGFQTFVGALMQSNGILDQDDIDTFLRLSTQFENCCRGFFVYYGSNPPNKLSEIDLSEVAAWPRDVVAGFAAYYCGGVFSPALLLQFSDSRRQWYRVSALSWLGPHEEV